MPDCLFRASTRSPRRHRELTSRGVVFSTALSAVALLFTAPTLLVGADEAFGQEHPPVSSSAVGSLLTIKRVDIGLAGRFKVGCWSPVTVHVSASQPHDVRLVIEVADPDGSITSLPGPVQRVPQGELHALHGTFKSGRIDSSLRIVVLDLQGRVLASREIHSAAAPGPNEIPLALTHSDRLVATLGNPAGFIALDNAMAGEAGAPPKSNESEKQERAPVAENHVRLAKVPAPEAFPNNSAAYESLDVLAMAGRYDVDAAQSDAIRDWVRLGGHLVVSVGGDSSDFANSPLTQWIPVKIDGASQLRDLSGLESYVGKNVRINFRGRRTVSAARLGPVDGVVEARAIDGPILVQVPFGFGKITFLAIDLSAEPFSSWDAAADLAKKISFAGEEAPMAKTASTRSRLSHSGITDMATQIHAAQEDFPQVHRPSMWTVMGLLVLYLLIIGPIDFFLVHRVLRKPELTWATFPVIAAIAAALAVWGAGHANGEKLAVNQLGLVDVDVASHLVRARSWVTLYSPKTARYNVQVRPTSLANGPPANDAPAPRSRPTSETPLRLAWSGVPENSYSGMYRLGGFEIARPGYAFAENASAIQNLPIPIWSTKALAATWQGERQQLVESDLSSSPSGGLVGSIVHHLPGPVENWVLAYGKVAYSPIVNQFDPGAASIRPDRPLRLSVNSQSIRRRNLSGHLTGLRRTVEEGGKTRDEQDRIEKDTYDPLGRSSEDIVRMLTFFGKAGGKSYTTLDNHQLRSLDLSQLLDMNRAVLFGRIATPAARIEVDGEEVNADRSDTYIRIVLPVKDHQSGVQAAATGDR